MKKKVFFIVISLLVIFFSVLLLISSNLTVTHYNYTSDRIPASFNNFKIVHLSDLHCKNFGQNNSKLIDKINDLDPDLILITGDNFDKYHSNMTNLNNLFKGIAGTAPIYSISGNHECDNPELYAQLLALYSKYDITDLDDKELFFTLGNDSIILKGLGAFENKLSWDKNFMENKNPEAISILLDHYPQIDQLARYEYDIILSGHLHGGVIRLPYLGGLINNNGSLFPEYSGGEYTLGKSTMFVSKGIGDTLIPRINNKPEIVCITLKNNIDIKE